MSYFGRLVEQSHLTVTGAAPAIPAVVSDVPAPLESLDGARLEQDSTDIVEISEVVDAAVAAPTAQMQNAPPQLSARDEQDVVAFDLSLPRVGETPRVELDRATALEQIDPESVARPSLPTAVTPAASAEGSTYEIAMRRVLEWVSGNSKPNAIPNAERSAAPSVEELVAERDAPSSRSIGRAMPGDDPADMSATDSSPRDMPSRSIALAPTVEHSLREAAPSVGSKAAGERGDKRPVSPIVDDLVHVSIGSISVRIEAPASPVPRAPSPPPRTAPPQGQSVARAPERGSSRLARRYLHP